MRSRIEALYREESRRVLATLIRLLGDFELAEEALHDAFIAAVEQWPRDGIPRNPRAWLVSAGRFKAIDNLRRRARFDASQRLLAEQLEEQAEAPAEEGDAVEDDRLRLIFTCCHPALTPEAQVALTLREVCDLRTEEIARAFLAAPSAIAQRIVRAKNKIREARIPYQVPTLEELPERLGNVLQVIYLVFNEGYSASTGASLTRADLSGEAIRVGRLLVELLPDPEALGLLALMLLHDSRRQARISASGELVRLDEQDRALWDRGLIVEGLGLLLWRVLPAAPSNELGLTYRQLLGSMFDLLASQRVLQVRGLLGLLMFAAFGVFWSSLVLLLGAPPHSLSHSAIGAFGLVGALGALGAARAGSLADRGHAQALSGGALLLLLLSWLPLALGAHSLAALILGVLLLDLAGQAIHVLNQSLVFAIDPRAHSRLVGCYMLFYAAGSGLGASAGTAMYAWAGWDAVSLLGAAISLAALAFWWFTRGVGGEARTACANGA
ncbi:sigma-70 family RNA polymerase sigma factor [Pseudomonas aeruginosa]|nr:sigma-70 family RNA polymerase sigma factor [Pseudomonas aeruginosa]